MGARTATHLARRHVSGCFRPNVNKGTRRFELDHRALDDFPSLEADLNEEKGWSFRSSRKNGNILVFMKQPRLHSPGVSN